MFLTILVFILILELLVFVHEWGHFKAARKQGVKVEEFGFGLPPRIKGWTRKGVIYSINWLPLGGFVRLKGENGDTQDSDSFSQKPWLTRLFILCAGVGMNLILTFVLLTFTFILGYPSVLGREPLPSSVKVSGQYLVITAVAPNSPAADSELNLGDRILKINNQPVTTIKTAQDVIRASDQVILEIKRDRITRLFTVTPELLATQSQKALGVGLEEVGLLHWPVLKAIGRGAIETFNLSVRLVQALGQILVDLWQHRGVSPEVGGPVAIAVLTNQVVNLGLSYVLQFAAVISLNFALINFLPFPALDGGRVLFLVIERLRGRSVSQRLEQWIHQLGFIFLIALALLITLRDLDRFEILKRIWK